MKKLSELIDEAVARRVEQDARRPLGEPLLRAVSEGDPAGVERALLDGADPRFHDESHCNAFHWAVAAGRADVLAILLAAVENGAPGAAEAAVAENGHRFTPLDLAISNVNAPMAETIAASVCHLIGEGEARSMARMASFGPDGAAPLAIHCAGIILAESERREMEASTPGADGRGAPEPL